MPHPTSGSALSPETQLDRAAARCRARGTSLTPIRRKVLDLLLGEPGGLKAYDLLDRMKEVHTATTPPTTVYRALDFLIEQGLAHKIARTNQFVACNHACHEDASLFLICPGCGVITELHDEQVLEALSLSLEQAGHRLAGPEIELSARCRNCMAAPRRPR